MLIRNIRTVGCCFSYIDYNRGYNC